MSKLSETTSALVAAQSGHNRREKPLLYRNGLASEQYPVIGFCYTRPAVFNISRIVLKTASSRMTGYIKSSNITNVSAVFAITKIKV